MNELKMPNAMPTDADKNGKPLRVHARTSRAQTISSTSEAIGQIDAEIAHIIPRPRSESVTHARYEIGAGIAKENREQSP